MSRPAPTTARGRRARGRPAGGWRQDALLDDFSLAGSAARVPAPLYHQRFRARAEVARTRRLRQQRLRQVAQLLLVVLAMTAAALLVVRLLGSVEPRPPDAGGVVNLLDNSSVATQFNAPLAEQARLAFVESPFTRPAVAPPIDAAAAMLVDLGERTIIYSRDAHARRPPASLAKLATAIVALELAPPDTRVQVPPQALQQPPNVVGLQPGEVLTLQDLLFAMLLASGNDAAVSVADGIGGETYTVAQMNDLARRLELRDTRFANSVGYDAAEQYASAFDLAVLASDAIERFPMLARIVATKNYVIAPGTANRGYSVTNLNGLLWSYSGALGIKTGRTESAGGNIIAAAQRDGRRLLVVVLGSANRLEDAATLLDYGFRALAAEG